MINIDNKKAYFDYEVIEKYEAGIVLEGSEVKSIRLGNASLRDSFCFVENGELFLKNCMISPYEKNFIVMPDPRKTRKLLLHSYELKRMIGKSKEKGLTIVPLKMYFKGNKVKVEIALGRGKKSYDKKESIKERDNNRDLERQLRNHQK